jgi:predicted porin
MKKTIIASAIAAVVAAPAAFADVSVSGNVYAETGETDGVDSTKVYTDVFFKASEDLGNGMKAFSTIQMYGDNDSKSSATYTDTGSLGAASTTTMDVASTDAGVRIVGLSGDFGTIEAGRMESFTEGAVAAMAANDPSHGVSNEPNNGNATWVQAVRYTSPSFNGLSIGYENDESASVSTVFATYSNGGLTIKAAQEDNNGTDSTNIAAKFSMDGITASVVSLDTDGGEETQWYGVSYTMGANTVAYSVNDGGSEDGDSTFSVQHKLSKNTSVYIAMDDDDSSSTADTTVLGLIQKF